jgi:hypothetical protein
VNKLRSKLKNGIFLALFQDYGFRKGVLVQLCDEKTIFMQKAIYYVTRLVAARGVVELTDLNLNFQVSALDSSFGMKNVSIDVSTISNLRIAGGNLSLAIVVTVADKDYEFVLPKASELYDNIKALRNNPVKTSLFESDSQLVCDCGKKISRVYKYCPWCGKRV